MIRHYFQSALGRLGKAPITTLANILTLALGLLAMITAWGIVSYWRSSDREIAPPGRVVTFTSDLIGGKNSSLKVSLVGTPETTEVLAKYLREDVPQLQKVARFRERGDIAVDTGERTVILQGANADPEFLDIFKLKFVVGDAKAALEREDGIVLTQEAAQKLFGDAPALGHRLALSRGRNVIVTAVIEPVPQPTHLGSGGETFDYLTTITPNPSGTPENWFGLSVTTYGLLPADGSLTPAALERSLEQMVERRIPKTVQGLGEVGAAIHAIDVQQVLEHRLNGALFGHGGGLSVVAVLFGLGALVLGVACLNYANLATAQAVGRTKETGMRKILGASLGGVLLQSWIEAGVSTVIALAITGAFLWLASPVIVAQMDIDIAGALLRDPVALASIAGIAIGATVISGLYPAFMVSRVRPADALRTGKARTGPQGVSQVLVAIQFAAASALLIAVFIIGQQNAHVRSLLLKRSSDPVVVLANNQLTGVSTETLRQQLFGYPQIKIVSESGRLPWGPGPMLNGLKRDLNPQSPDQKGAVIPVGFDYFNVFDQKLLAGRFYDQARDAVAPPSPSAPPAASNATRPLIIDRAYATFLGFASPKDAVGQTLYAAFGPKPTPIEIIGVVETKPHQLQGTLGGGTMYRLQPASPNNSPIIRIAASDIEGGLAAIQRVWNQVAPTMPLNYQFEDQIFERNFRAFERVSRMFQALSALAFLISAIGLFGMAVHVIQRRMHEIGVRKVLGSTASRVVGLLLADFSKPVIVANLLAWPLAWYAAQAYLAPFADRIEVSVWPFMISLAVTLLIAWLSVGGQTIRAATIQPANVLRRS